MEVALKQEAAEGKSVDKLEVAVINLMVQIIHVEVVAEGKFLFLHLQLPCQFHFLKH